MIDLTDQPENRAAISPEVALNIARNLKSENGENSEYDRALFEFLYDAFIWGNQEHLAYMLGVDLNRLYFKSKDKT